MFGDALNRIRGALHLAANELLVIAHLQDKHRTARQAAEHGFQEVTDFADANRVASQGESAHWTDILGGVSGMFLPGPLKYLGLVNQGLFGNSSGLLGSFLDDRQGGLFGT